MKQNYSVDTGVIYPVFEGLANAGFAGKKLAEIVGVSAPTLSKWRTGRSRMTGAQLVLLTLILAHMIEEVETMELHMGNNPETNMNKLYSTLCNSLHVQEIRNLALSPTEVHAGARLYRTWFESTGGAISLPIAAMTNRRIANSVPAQMAAQ